MIRTNRRISPYVPITLPKPAWRCSWLMERADARCNFFARLLERVDPGHVVEQRFGRLSAYYALLDYLETRFPVFVPEFEDTWGDEDWNPIEQAEGMGIPIDLMGRYYDDRFEVSNGAAFAAVEWFLTCTHERELMESGRYTSDLMDVDHYPALRPISHLLIEFKAMNFIRNYGRIGRAAQWRPPWDGLVELVKYCEGDTGLVFLDNSHMEVSEAGGEYPMWTIGEIRALEREWSKAKPVHDRIVALAEYVDQEPGARVPMLLRLLSGDADLRMSLVVYQARSKTLAEVFGEKA